MTKSWINQVERDGVMDINRYDGRNFDSLRKIDIERDFSKHAEGSCLITVGSTKVICTATVEKNVPFFLRGSGSGWIKAEYGMLPRATNTRNVRDRVSGRSMEIQRLIGRSLRSIVDMKKFGERTIWIDCDVIQADGGTRTASIVGGFVALVDCLYKLYRDAVITTFPVTEFLGATSVGLWRGNHILDLDYREDSEVDVDMNMVMTASGRFVEIQGTGEQNTFSRQDLNAFLDLAQKGIDEIVRIERRELSDIQPHLV